MLSGTFDPDAEAALAWCLREAVTNVVRHSGAANCYISLTSRSGTMSLTVRDDGRGATGCDPARSRQRRRREPAVGLAVRTASACPSRRVRAARHGGAAERGRRHAWNCARTCAPASA